MPPSTTNISATQSVPFMYRLLILSIEPIMAVVGSYVAYAQLNVYLSTLTRGVITVPPNSDFIGTQLAGGWLFFAFTEAIVLRAVDDLAVWQWIVYGMLLSDAAYCHSVAQAIGGWGEFVQVQNWTQAEWTVSITTFPFVLTRACIALGIGLKKTKRD